MATHKVPQDVEAEDKLLGPWTLKQFIFILMFFGACWIAFLLSRIALPFGALMLPFIVAFGVLGFVQRKDQPVEVYLTAFIRFNLKPHRRRWDQEGYYQHVIITAPKIIERPRFQDISQNEVHSRLDNLAKMMDSRGWAAKGLVTTQSDRLVDITVPESALEAEVERDILDDQQHVSQKFAELIDQQTEQTRATALQHMNEARTGTENPAANQPLPTLTADSFNPYPTAIHQTVISPSGTQPAAPAPSTNDDAFITGSDEADAAYMAQIVGGTTNDVQAAVPPASGQGAAEQPAGQGVPTQVSPDIIRLATNTDRTVSSIAKEAHQLPTEEVVISLR